CTVSNLQSPTQEPRPPSPQPSPPGSWSLLTSTQAGHRGHSAVALEPETIQNLRRPARKIWDMLSSPRVRGNGAFEREKIQALRCPARRVVFAFLCLSFVRLQALALDWPTYMHDAQRSGVTSEQLATNLAAAWVFPRLPKPSPAWGDEAKKDAY